MADPYVARSVYDQGIAPFAKKVQGFLKGTAGLPGTVKDYVVETIQSEGGPTTKVMADLLALGQGMSQGFQDNPLRAVAEMYPPVGLGSDLFEMGNLLTLAEQAEEAGDLEKAQTLRELSNTVFLMGVVPGGPPSKNIIDQKLKDMAKKRQKLTEETGLPYVPSNKPDLGEGKRIYGEESPQDTALRNKLASADIKFSMDRDAPGMDLESFNMINDPEHFIKSRGKITNIEQMSPTEYIERVSKDVFPTFGEAEIRRQRERTGKIPLMMEAMQEGTEFGLPTIHYDDGTRKFPSQEGLHRAMAAERLGVPEIPVAIHQLDRSPAARAARAEEFGFTHDVYHGTRSPDVTEIDENLVDLGLHVGSYEQANNRLKDLSERGRYSGAYDEGSNIMPLKAKMENILEMKDVGGWNNSYQVLEELERHPVFASNRNEISELVQEADDLQQSYMYGEAEWTDSPDNRELLNEAKRLITDKGYDTISYKNQVENTYDGGTIRPEFQNQINDLHKQERNIQNTVRERMPKAPLPTDLNVEVKLQEFFNAKESDYRLPEETQAIEAIREQIKVIRDNPSNYLDSHSYIILDPKNVRSTSADFNPLRMNEADLQAGIASLGAREGTA